MYPPAIPHLTLILLIDFDGIEVPNKVTETVTMREIVDSSAFRDAKSKLTVALGKDDWK